MSTTKVRGGVIVHNRSYVATSRGLHASIIAADKRDPKKRQLRWWNRLVATERRAPRL